MVESTVTSMQMVGVTDYNSWNLEIETLFEQKQALGIVDCTEETQDDGTELKSWNKQHGIAWSTILLTMESTSQQQLGVQKDSKAWWDQLKEDYKSKVMLSVWPLRNDMSAVTLRDCENLQEYALNIQSYVNDFNHWANNSTHGGTFPKREHSYYLVKGIPKNEAWRFFTQSIDGKIDTLAH